MKRLLPLFAAALLASCAGAKLEKQRKEIEDLETKAGSMLSQLKDKTDEVDALKASKAELEGKVVELEGRAAAAEGRVTTLAKSNKDLAASAGASTDELGGKLKEVVTEKDELARRLSDALKEKLALERLKTVYASARDRAAKELAKVQAEREKLAAAFAAAESEKKAAADSRSAALLRAREEMGAVADALLPELQSGAARVEQDGAGFALSISDSALFDEGSAKVHEKGAALLAKAGAALKPLAGRELRVSAHSDNAPFKKNLIGGFAGHWELTAARATAVARWLHEHAGVDPARLSAAGFGEFRPVKPNDSDENRAANRRVTISVAPSQP